eukprot:GHVS01021810.1.p1 GENE.GHVS01021810.1~~GHVS01021810.1.p1  ORF type:complete len:302 (-),score=14.75 GHVS01021810.1:25-930(-)
MAEKVWASRSPNPVSESSPSGQNSVFTAQYSEELLAILQISDSSFPIGGFCHSNGTKTFGAPSLSWKSYCCLFFRFTISGYEAALQLGYIKGIGSLLSFCEQVVENTSSFYVPYVREAYNITATFLSTECQCGSTDSPSCSREDDGQDLVPVARLCLTVGSDGRKPDTLDNCTCSKIDSLYEILKLDSFLDAAMSNHVSRRASIRQGSGLLVTAMETLIPASERSCRLNLGMGRSGFRSDAQLQTSSELHTEHSVSTILTFLQAAQDDGDFFAHFPVVFGEVCAAREISLNACLQVRKTVN